MTARDLAKKYETESLQFIKHDMRNEFPSSNFDLIVNLFTSFGYFDSEKEDLVVLKNVFNALSDEGIFVLDFMNASKVITNLVASEKVVKENVIFSLTRKHENGFIIKNISIDDNGVVSNFQEKVRGFTQSEMVALFEKTGFKIVSTFGSYELEPFSEKYSDRLVIVACKNS